MNWFLIPAQTENIDRSIRKPVAISELRPFLGDEVSERLATLGDGELRCWAMTDGSKAQFDKMTPGDRVLISERGTKKFNYVAEVTALITSKDLGDHLWPVKPRANGETSDEQSWDYIYFLKNVCAIDADKSQLVTLLGFKPNYVVPGSRQIDSDTLVKFETSNGPILEWLHMNAGLPRQTRLTPKPVTVRPEMLTPLSSSSSIGNEYVPVLIASTYDARDQQTFLYNAEKADRGNKGHMTTQNALAEYLEAQGLSPRSPAVTEPDFDLAWMIGDTVFVAEVKSTTKENEKHQLRLGLGQVLWYRHRLAAHGRTVVAVLVPERKPSSELWLDLCASLGVRIGWPTAFERVLAPVTDGMKMPG